jgi:serine protease Do
VDSAQPVMQSLLRGGKVDRGWLGVAIQDLNEEMAQALGFPGVKGVVVADVQPESPAATAGLRRDDVITELDGRRMDSVAHLRNHVASAGQGTKVRVRLLRGGKPLELTITLGVLPGDQVARLDATQGVLGGLTLEPITEETRRKLGLGGTTGGVRVRAVEPGSAADAADLRAGDLILEINRRAVADAYEFSTIYKGAKGKLLLLVYRLGSTMYLLLER